MTELDLALAPVRDALLAGARRDADRMLGDAEAESTATLAAARSTAERLLVEARELGAADGTQVARLVSARTRRQSRSALLDARREVYDELRAHCLQAVLQLPGRPAYPGLLARLTAQARATLGPEAAITEHPQGGIVASTPGRHLDLSLPTLTEEAVTALGVRIEDLWAP
jgi:vacuolar-type H+-ATPase subunit E/Vma4